MKTAQSIFNILFILTCIINLAAEAISSRELIYLSKPLLMVFLSLFFYFATRNKFTTFAKFILLGFIFSIGGDTLLMFVENESDKQEFFLYGLVSFLITHICYLIAFLKWPSEIPGFVATRKWLALPFLLFLIGNCAFLWPGIPADMKIPVVVYSSVIILMTVACLNLKSKLLPNTFWLLFAGVLLFVCSDSIIAFNKFKTPLEYARLMIMPLYLAGQYLIALGAIKANETITA